MALTLEQMKNTQKKTSHYAIDYAGICSNDEIIEKKTFHFRECDTHFSECC